MKKRISITATILLAVLFAAVTMPLSTSAKANTGSIPLVQENCVVTGSNNAPLRVRATPGGRVIGSLKLGANILAYGTEQDNYGDYWTKIRFKRGFGYISTRFVSCG